KHTEREDETLVRIQSFQCPLDDVIYFFTPQLFVGLRAASAQTQRRAVFKSNPISICSPGAERFTSDIFGNTKEPCRKLLVGIWSQAADFSERADKGFLSQVFG